MSQVAPDPAFHAGRGLLRGVELVEAAVVLVDHEDVLVAAALDVRVGRDRVARPCRSGRRTTTRRWWSWAGRRRTTLWGMPIAPPSHRPEPKSALSDFVAPGELIQVGRAGLDGQRGDVRAPHRVGRRDRAAGRHPGDGDEAARGQQRQGHAAATAADRTSGRVDRRASAIGGWLHRCRLLASIRPGGPHPMGPSTHAAAELEPPRAARDHDLAGVGIRRAPAPARSGPGGR